jgi:hypothetical protein
MDESARGEKQVATDSVASNRVTYHEETGTYRAEFDSHTRLATEAVVWAVAEATGTDPLELPTLGSVLDPDSLNELFDLSVWDPTRDDTSLSFRYADHSVTVHGYGGVVVTPPSATDP